MLSLSFEGNTLRLLETQGRKVVRWHSALFNTALMHRGAVADPAGLSQVLAKAMQAGKFKSREVFAAIDGTNSLSRVIPAPHGVSARNSDFFLREARRLWSLNPDDVFLYWQPIAGQKQQIFVLSIPREPLYALKDTLRMAGLRPVKLDTRPLCLARAANLNRAVLICVESTSIVIAVLSERLPVFMQTHWLRDMPTSSESISDQASTLLSQALAYYGDTYSADRLPLDTPLFVCGASAGQALCDRLKSDTGYTLQDITPLFQTPPDFPLAQFAVNLGLLMKVL
ncbi:MAG: hypothetical protein HYX87_08230 [Chloroflexi bacterium]|nr:hypothetical protein [Chloroflexota bacterium]